ncbi:unnamed protein product [Symbiodinium sp. KB8]|nr:unnamed protein product [Symbiodinium sp. KB8]
MLQILRGLCISVDAEGMPMLQIFSSHAKVPSLVPSLAYVTMGPPQKWVAPMPLKKPRQGQADQDSQDDPRMADDVMGRSSIYGRLYGMLSSIDARPVTEKTRFPLLGATAGIGSPLALV